MFYDKDSFKFSTHYFLIPKQTIGRWIDSLSSVFYTGSHKARFFSQPECALYLNFTIIVNAVITAITAVLSQYFFSLRNCIFKRVGSVFYLYETALFLLLLYIIIIIIVISTTVTNDWRQRSVQTSRKL